jgi:hypothetical protein
MEHRILENVQGALSPGVHPLDALAILVNALEHLDHHRALVVAGEPLGMQGASPTQISG